MRTTKWMFLGAVSAATCAGAALAQEPDGIAALLESIDAPGLEEVVAHFEPSTTLEELLAAPAEPEPGRWFAGADALRLAQLAKEVEWACASDQLEAAVSAAEEALAIAEDSLGEDHAAARRARSELESLESALELPDEEREQLARSHQQTGQLMIAYRDRRPEEAQRIVLAQLAAWAKLLGPESPVTASGLANAAQVLQTTGAGPRSLPLALAALELELRLAGEGHPNVAGLLHQIGLAARDLGELDAAWRLHLAAAERAQRLTGARVESTSAILSDLGALAQHLGELDAARRLYERCLEVSDEGWLPENRASLLDNLGTVLLSLGQLDQARGSLLRAYELRRDTYAGDHPDVAISLSKLESLASLRGDYAEAKRWARQALDMKRRMWQGDHQRLVVDLRNFAILLRTMGDDAASLAAAEEALAMGHRLYGGEHPEIVPDLATVGVSLSELNRLDEAVEYLEAAVELHRTAIPRETLQLAETLRNLATALHRLGRADEARACNDEARATLVRLEFERSKAMAWVLDVDAQLAAKTGDGRTAITAAAKAADLMRELNGPTHPAVGRRLARLGSLRWQFGGPGGLERAEGELREALAMAEHELADEVGSVVEYSPERVLTIARAPILDLLLERSRFAGRLGHAETARQLARVLLEREELTAAVEVAERGRERTLHDLLSGADREAAPRSGSPDLEAVARLDAALARETRARKDALGARFAMEALERHGDLGAEKRRAKREEWIGLQAELRDAESALAAELSAGFEARAPARLDGIRTALGEGEAALYFVWARASVSALLVPRSGEVLGASLARGETEVAALAELVERALGRVRGATDAALETDAEPPERRLARHVLPPAWWERVRALERLVVLADGPLARVPLEVLPLGPGGMMLLEEGPNVVYAPSVSVLRDLARRRDAEPRAPTALVLGDPRFEGDGEDTPTGLDGDEDLLRAAFGGELRRLAGSGAEARRVSELVREAGGSARVLLREAATLAALEAELEGATHLHLGTHGRIGSAERPYAAALALAAPAEGARGETAFLTLERMIRGWRGRLAGCELVVLSACETQRGAAVGDSTIALPWGFFYAGAPRVVVSLWKVHDAATALLMSRLYENLLGRHDDERDVAGARYPAGARMPAERALREARLWLRSRSPEQNARALEQLGLAEEGAERDGAGPPGPSGAIRAIPRALTHDYSHPRHWAAFVLTGAPER